MSKDDSWTGLNRRKFLNGLAAAVTQVTSGNKALLKYGLSVVQSTLVPVAPVPNKFLEHFWSNLDLFYIRQGSALKKLFNGENDLGPRQYYLLDEYAGHVSFFLYLERCENVDTLLANIPPKLIEKAAKAKVDLSLLADKKAIEEHINLLTKNAWQEQCRILDSARYKGMDVLLFFENGQTDMAHVACCGLRHPITEFWDQNHVYEMTKEDLPFLAELNFLQRFRFQAGSLPLSHVQRDFLGLFEKHPLNQIQQYTRYYASYGAPGDFFNKAIPIDARVAGFDLSIDKLRERLNEDLETYNLKGSVPVPYDFLQKTRHLSPADASQALIEHDLRISRALENDIWGNISFSQLHADAPDSLEPAVHVNGVAGHFRVNGLEGTRLRTDSLETLLSKHFSSAVDLFGSKKSGPTIQIGWDCTMQDLMTVDDKLHADYRL